MLHLIVPGLGRPWPDAVERPAAPALDRLLARSDRFAGAGSYAEALFELFHIPNDARATAPFCWLGLKGEPPQGWVMHADPVHFRADRDRLLLFNLPEESVSLDEAKEFARAFNDHFASDGIALHVLARQQWFLAMERRPAAEFVPPEAAMGGPLGEAMPEGPEAGYWRQLMNEVQMLFFQLPANSAREARGELAVNGLWFSSPGRITTPVGIAPELVSVGEDPLLGGLLESAEEQDAAERLLVFPLLESAFRQHDSRALGTALQRLDTLVTELLRREPELRLHDCGGRCWHWQRAMKWRFWRRRTDWQNAGKAITGPSGNGG